MLAGCIGTGPTVGGPSIASPALGFGTACLPDILVGISHAFQMTVPCSSQGVKNHMVTGGEISLGVALPVGVALAPVVVGLASRPVLVPGPVPRGAWRGMEEGLSKA